MKKIIVFLVTLIIVSCSDKKKKNDQNLILAKSEVKDFFILDSLFIGEPMAEDTVFVEETTNPAADDWIVDRFDSILNKQHAIFSRFKSNEIIKSVNVTNDLSLELKRKKYNIDEDLKDIQVVLYTKFKGIVKDSILFYKYQIDKFDNEYIDQRHEALTYINEGLNLYNLQTYTGMDEFERGVGPDLWNEYLIVKETGKIELLSTMANLAEIKKKEEKKLKPTISNNNLISHSRIKHLEYDFENTSFFYDCNESDRITFSLNWGDFSCPSNEIRFNAELMKIDENNFELKYSEIKGYAIERSLDSENYSKEISIGNLKYLNNELEFKWFGFYNTRTKRREFTQNPLTGKVESSSIILRKCN